MSAPGSRIIGEVSGDVARRLLPPELGYERQAGVMSIARYF